MFECMCERAGMCRVRAYRVVITHVRIYLSNQATLRVRHVQSRDWLINDSQFVYVLSYALWATGQKNTHIFSHLLSVIETTLMRFAKS